MGIDMGTGKRLGFGILILGVISLAFMLSNNSEITGLATGKQGCLELNTYTDGLIINKSVIDAYGKNITLCASNDSIKINGSSQLINMASHPQFTKNYSISILVEEDDVVLDCADDVLEGDDDSIGIAAINVTGAEIKNCQLEGYFTGILLNKVSSGVIEKNTIEGYSVESGSAGFGIVLLDSKFNTLQQNFMSNLFAGTVFSNSGSFFVNNVIASSELGTQSYKSNGLDFINNTYSGLQVGAYLQNSEGNTFTYNNFLDFKVGALAANTSKAVLHHNIFEYLNNSGLVGAVKSEIKWYAENEACGANVSCKEGNYWSGYSALQDADGNGIGDVEFTISSGNADPAPFVNKKFALTETCSVTGGNGLDDDHDGLVDEICLESYDLKASSGEFSFKEGDKVSFECRDASYTFNLTAVEPPIVYFGGNYYSADELNLDVDSDGKSDVKITDGGVSGGKRKLNIQLYDTCTVWCGNSVCDLGENTATCVGDCLAGSCGNDVCDMGENKDNCALDCTKKYNFSILIWVIIIAVIALGGATAFYLWQSGTFGGSLGDSMAPPSDLEKAEIETKPKAPEELTNYIESYLSKGYSAAQIRQVLETEGWTKSQIEGGLREVASTPREEVEEQAAPTKGVLSSLKEYVETQKEKGKSNSDIESELKKAGWDDAIIRTVLK